MPLQYTKNVDSLNHVIDITFKLAQSDHIKRWALYSHILNDNRSRETDTVKALNDQGIFQ